MAIEPVNERPIFPSATRWDNYGLGSWTVSMIRQLTTVFQQYGYRLNNALLKEDLDTNGGDVVTDGGDSVLRDSDLAENGGTIPETDRANTFSAPITIDTGASTGKTYFEIDGHRPFRFRQGLGPDSNAPLFLDTVANNPFFIGRYDESETWAKFFSNGTVLGAPTGGTKGFGTINAEAVYDDGSRVLAGRDLGSSGGNLAELDQPNFFSSQTSLSSNQFIDVKRPDGDGSSNHVADIDALDLTSGDFLFRIGRRTNTSGNLIVSFNNLDGTTSSWVIFSKNQGVQFGNPSGGYQGAGTLNAEGVYDDGSLLTDYVFDAEIDGNVDTKWYDDAVPNRKIEDESGELLREEERTHRPARDFKGNMDELDPAEFERRWRQSRKLPAVARAEANSQAPTKGKLSLGEQNQALLETCEVQAVHIAKLNDKIEQLEGRLAALEANK